MNPQALHDRLRSTPFDPFIIVMNNGLRYEVRHPEFALLDDRGILHLFEPSRAAEADVSRHVTVGVYNISTLEPLPEQAA